MTDSQKLAEAYVAVWNETDADARRARIAEVFTEDVRFVDPLAEVTGHAGIDAVVGGAQAQFQGLPIRLAGPVDAHHDQVRFTWELGPADGEAVVVGFDVAVRAEDGRISLVLGFLDTVPTAA